LVSRVLGLEEIADSRIEGVDWSCQYEYEYDPIEKESEEM
jgi:hypothetical protein